MKRLSALVALLIAVIGASPARAQADPVAPGAICILAYADANRNAIREEGEPLLSAVSANLKQNGVLLSNLIVDERTNIEYCFRNLPAGAYTVSFNSPFADATTPTQFDFALKPGEQVQAWFGGVPQGKIGNPDGLTIPLQREVRLALAIGGAGVVMLFMFGLGLVLRNLAALRRKGRRGDSNRPDARAASRG
jgi:hypothetical protein